MAMNRILFLFIIFFPISASTQVVDSVWIINFDSMVLKAQVYIDKKDFPNALIKLTEAEKVIQEVGESSSFQFGELRFLQGRVSYFKKDYHQAEIYYNESIAIYKQLNSKIHPVYTKCIMALGVLFYVQKNFIQAEPYFLEAKLNYEKTIGTEHLDYAKCMNNLAGIYTEFGYYEKAESYFKKSKSIWEAKSPEHPNFAVSINSLAVLYTTMGEYKKAELLYLQAIDVRKKTLGTNHQDYAASLSNLGTLYAFMRNYDKAENLMLQSLHIREQVYGRRSEPVAIELNNLALLYKNMGKDENLEKYFLEAKSIWEELSAMETSYYATVVKNLGVYHMTKKNYPVADSLFKIALNKYEKIVGKGHQDYASVLSYLGYIETIKHHFAEAEKYLLETKNILELSLGLQNEFYTNSLNALFFLYWEKQDFNSASQYLIQVLHNDISSLQTASTHLSEKELRTFIVDFSKRLNYSFSFIPHKNELIEECYNDILFFKGFLLNSRSQLKNYANSDSISEDYFNQLKAAHRLLSIEYSKPIASQRNVSDLEEKANSIEKLLITNNKLYSLAINQVKWNQICNQLKTGEAAVEFVHYQLYSPELIDSIIYAAMILRKGDLKPKFILLFEERELNNLLQAHSTKKSDYVNGLYNTIDRGIMEDKKLNKSLYELLWKPMEIELLGINKIYYSPSGLIHRINLDAIPINQEIILSDKYTLIGLNSTRQLVISNSVDIKNNEAVLFGGLRFDYDSTQLNHGILMASNDRSDNADSQIVSVNRSGTWNYLLGTEKEVNSLEKILTSSGIKVEIKKGYEGTEESFKEIGRTLIGSPRILHIATHGYFFPDADRTISAKGRMTNDPAYSGGTASEGTAKAASSKLKVEFETTEPVFKTSEHPMLRSGLIMAGGNAAWQGNQTLEGKEDGILTAYEISQMNLSNTELVVLSACETGLGDIEGNEGVYGLQRAFKIAGAKYLIMSLWQVPDKQTSILMTTFYKKWLEEKMNIPDAFHAAQKELRDLGLDPYQWAGFVLVE